MLTVAVDIGVGDDLAFPNQPLHDLADHIIQLLIAEPMQVVIHMRFALAALYEGYLVLLRHGPFNGEKVLGFRSRKERSTSRAGPIKAAAGATPEFHPGLEPAVRFHQNHLAMGQAPRQSRDIVMPWQCLGFASRASSAARANSVVHHRPPSDEWPLASRTGTVSWGSAWEFVVRVGTGGKRLLHMQLSTAMPNCVRSPFSQFFGSRSEPNSAKRFVHWFLYLRGPCIAAPTSWE